MSTGSAITRAPVSRYAENHCPCNLSRVTISRYTNDYHFYLCGTKIGYTDDYVVLEYPAWSNEFSLSIVHFLCLLSSNTEYQLRYAAKPTFVFSQAPFNHAPSQAPSATISKLFDKVPNHSIYSHYCWFSKGYQDKSQGGYRTFA